MLNILYTEPNLDFKCVHTYTINVYAYIYSALKKLLNKIHWLGKNKVKPTIWQVLVDCI